VVGVSPGTVGVWGGTGCVGELPGVVAVAATVGGTDDVAVGSASPYSQTSVSSV
jgi:hypothetical protein